MLYRVLMCFYQRQAIISRGHRQLSISARWAYHTLVTIVLQRYYLGNKPLTLTLSHREGRRRPPPTQSRQREHEGDVAWRYRYNRKTKP